MGQHFLFLAVSSLPTDALRVIAAECQLWEHDTDMQSEQEKTEKRSCRPLFALTNIFQELLAKKQHSTIVVLLIIRRALF